MQQAEIYARHFATHEPVRLQWQDGAILRLEPASASPPPNLWLAPSLVDLQINGFAGVDFQQDNLTVEDLLAALQGLQRAGCATFLLTLITDAWPRLMARLKHLRQLRSQSPALRNAIAGWHIEGPFLSDQHGFCGIHDPSCMCDPTAEHIAELREVTGADPVLLTLAPERPSAPQAIALAVSRGIKVSLGHTNASPEHLRQAIQAGATAFTHLGNGCPQQLDRHDNILWRVLDLEGLTISLIPDGMHVSPALFRLIHRLRSGSLYYTTDAMAAAGAPPGRYRIGKLEVEVGADQVSRKPGSPFFAGSALQPIQGVFRAARMLNRSWREVWPRFSETPAAFMGMRHSLEPGAPANFALLQVTPEGRLESLQLCAQGALLPPMPPPACDLPPHPAA